MSYLFPIAYMSVTYAMTALLIVFGLTGKVGTAADIGIIHAATLATFYALSANSRNMILNSSRYISLRDILSYRLLLIVPLAAIAFVLSVFIAGISGVLASALLLRRCTEWINEVHLSEREVEGDRKFALKFLFVQASLLSLVIGLSFWKKDAALTGMYLWAIVPLVMSAKFVARNAYFSVSRFVSVFPHMLSHLGSTATIGIAMYVFRLLILLFAGRATAGELFTAFSIGSFSGSMFANVLGPSMSLHEIRTGRAYFPTILKLILVAMSVAGAMIFAAAIVNARIFEVSPRSMLFWEGLGLSLIGGAVMVLAQRIRLRLLRLDNGVDVFGPDMFAHGLLIMATACLYLTRGVAGLGALYLVNAVLLYLFYLSAGRGHDRVSGPVSGFFDKFDARFLIALSLFTPLFLQLSGHIYHAHVASLDSGGNILTLPLPVAVLGCYGGVLLLSNYRKGYSALGFVFLFFCLMLGASILSTAGHFSQERAKLLLLLQFLLPTLALVLGQIFETENGRTNVIERAFLYTLLLIVPAQLVASWSQGRHVLTSDLYIFTVYQSLEYVPVIFVSGFLISLYSLWDDSRYRKLIYILVPFISMYAIASLSMLAAFEIVCGMLVFTLFRIRSHRKIEAIAPFLVVLIFMGGYAHLIRSSAEATNKFGSFGSAGGIHVAAIGSFAEHQRSKELNTMRFLPTNMALRIIDWEFYGKGIVEDGSSFVLGHAQPLARSVSTNAHNYYLDLLYNFGVISLFPLIIWIGYTLFLVARLWRKIGESSGTFSLVAVVAFLLLVDSVFKVTLREPYPGIFAFFVWGVLLSRLSGLKGSGPRDDGFDADNRPVAAGN